MQSGQDIAFRKKNFKAALVENTVLADKVAALENQLREQAEAYEKALLSIQEKWLNLILRCWKNSLAS